MAKFEMYTDKRGEFRFRLKAANGQTILASEGYKTKASCNNGVESVRKNSQEDKRFERLVSKSGQPYFNLKAANGQVIGNSEMYTTESAMENGISSVKKNASEAVSEDLT
ncbi:YegP family protein [Zhouia spongiae]|uniref:YegP family protein n=1 Tax=Zhouia spongiae TaxID=2202721 RepID=A0ABY3YQ67_9FLAO|nr:YegP family protein [Zhouia spongiae]UNY99793.1 YegP family protein [Zhouia spongiae]